MIILKQLIENMIGEYLSESYEDDLVESIFEEVSSDTWEAIEEAILSELSPALLKRYKDKAADRKQIAGFYGNDKDYENKEKGIARASSSVDKQKNDYDNLSAAEFKKKYRKTKSQWYDNYEMSKKRRG